MTSPYSHFQALAKEREEAFGLTENERFDAQRWFMAGVNFAKGTPDAQLSDEDIQRLMVLAGFKLPLDHKAEIEAVRIVRELLRLVKEGA